MKTAFVVDDDITYQKFMQVHLRKFGYEVKSFIDGHGCMLHLSEEPGLIILDQNLEEDKKGLDYLREIRNLAPKIPVLFLSAQNDMEAAVEALKLGAVDYIEKNSASYVRLRTTLERLDQEQKPGAKIKFKNLYWFITGFLTALSITAIMFWLKLILK